MDEETRMKLSEAKAWRIVSPLLGVTCALYAGQMVFRARPGLAVLFAIGLDLSIYFWVRSAVRIDKITNTTGGGSP